MWNLSKLWATVAQAQGLPPNRWIIGRRVAEFYSFYTGLGLLLLPKSGLAGLIGAIVIRSVTTVRRSIRNIRFVAVSSAKETMASVADAIGKSNTNLFFQFDPNLKVKGANLEIPVYFI